MFFVGSKLIALVYPWTNKLLEHTIALCPIDLGL